MGHNEQAELLSAQISDMERLVRYFDTLREKVSDLVEKAPHDPTAVECLVQLEQVWKNGIQQKAEQMEQYMKQVLRTGAQHQQMKQLLNNGVVGVENPTVNIPPTQKSPIRKKTRRFV